MGSRFHIEEVTRRAEEEREKLAEKKRREEAEKPDDKRPAHTFLDAQLERAHREREAAERG